MRQEVVGCPTQMGWMWKKRHDMFWRCAVKMFEMNWSLMNVFPFVWRRCFGSFFLQNEYLKRNCGERVVVGDFVMVDVEMNFDEHVPESIVGSIKMSFYRQARGKPCECV